MSDNDHATQPPPDAPSDGPSFPVVGVGASAGGLEAFTELLRHLPADPGLAILYVAHLEPHRKSQLPELLGRVTPLTVVQAGEGMAVEPDHVYILPPNTNMALADGHLRLTAREPARAQHMPIDHLFRSLAALRKARAIGVLLSGGGSDGTLGFRSIKAEGGITFAQDEQSARQAGMPRSAAADGSVDFVLPPREIAAQLLRLTRHPYIGAGGAADAAAAGAALADVLALVRSATGIDFTHYKRTTIGRRIHRRMALRGLENVADYHRLLRDDPAEARNLYQDFLIRVTQFFRDPEAYETLREKVFPRLVQGRTADRPLRVWVAGCATGEEVYSLAICLQEFLGAQPAAAPVKILATDLNEAALDRARAGVYPDNIEADVSPERLRRFFARADGHYQISKAVRDLCVFSRHNLAVDPPFSRVDLVSCRNVLIYMDAALQKRVLPALHYALVPEGFLFLGNSESVGSFSELFDAADARHRIFVKRPGPAALPPDVRVFPTAEGVGRRPAPAGGPLWTALDVQKEADRIVLARYAPVGVVVDETATVVQFRGRTSDYLEPAPGLASLDLMRMLREGLLVEVRAAFNQARAENSAVTRKGLRVAGDDRVRQVTVEVIPFKVPPAGARFFLVLFDDAAAAPPRPAPAAEAPRPPPRPSSPSSSRNSPPCASTSSPSSRSTRAPTRNSRAPTRRSSPPTRSCRAPTRSCRPPRRRPSPPTRSWPPSTRSCSTATPTWPASTTT